MVDEKAQTVLPPNEYTSFSYYLDEYLSKRMSIDLFVEVLLDLFNTADKYTILTELREVVSINDRAHFDELVYRNSSRHFIYSRSTDDRFSKVILCRESFKK